MLLQLIQKLHYLSIQLINIYILLVRAFAIDMYLPNHLNLAQLQLQYSKLFFSLSVKFSDFKIKLERIFEVPFSLIILAMILEKFTSPKNSNY